MNLSYWELKTWLNNVDYTIVGSGIVGLSTALHLKKKALNAKIVILEKGPQSCMLAQETRRKRETDAVPAPGVCNISQIQTKKNVVLYVLKRT